MHPKGSSARESPATRPVTRQHGRRGSPKSFARYPSTAIGELAMHFVGLNTVKQGTVFVNPEHVVAILPIKEGSSLVRIVATGTEHESFVVASDPQEVVQQLVG